MVRGTIFRVWLPLALGLYAVYFIFAHGPGPRDVGRWIGFALTLIGLAGVTLARHTLGRSFSIRAKATELVTTGIYSRIRNPIYISGMIFFLGIVVIMRRSASWLGLFFLLIIPMQIVRAGREARVLEAKFGDAYRQYRNRTWF